MSKKTKSRTIRIPQKIDEWILTQSKKSGRDYSKEVVYRLYTLMDD